MQDMIYFVMYFIAIQFVVFAVIVFVLKRVLMGDTLSAVNRLRQVEDELRKKEDALKRRMEEQEAELGKKRAEALAELETAREQSAKEASQLKEALVAEARQESQRIIDAAEKDRGRMRHELEQQVEVTALEQVGEVFHSVFSDRVSDALDRQFIAELLAALEEVDETSVTVDAEEAECTTSRPLEPDQKQALQKILSAKFGAELGLREQVDPVLLSGMVLKLGSLVIDGSLSNRFKEVITATKKAKMHQGDG